MATAEFSKFAGILNSVKERGLKRKEIYSHLDLGFVASKFVIKQMSLVEVTQFMVFCYGSPSKLIQQVR